ncbi:hypothetical protein EYF80_037773 [Liparis tanakae]|uniref:Uncharacterized protein n=1 Tax=Liparis tanakae TaxID=230148 RepID=A0A4Z2GF43_9TELE|nr:hypothetical protein EYF80_037773 [Liparis tanakae]
MKESKSPCGENMKERKSLCGESMEESNSPCGERMKENHGQKCANCLSSSALCSVCTHLSGEGLSVQQVFGALAVLAAEV